MNKEASHCVRLFGGSKGGNLIFWIPLVLLIKYGSGVIKTAHSLPWTGHCVTEQIAQHSYSKSYKLLIIIRHFPVILTMTPFMPKIKQHTLPEKTTKKQQGRYYIYNKNKILL